MTLLDVSDLQGTLAPEQALGRAEAVVAQAICPGLPDLAEHTWVCEYRMRNDARAFGVPLYGRRRLGPEVLKYWPVTGLVSVTEDGIDVTAQCMADLFSIRRDALAPEFGSGVIVATFKTGWPDGDSLPDAIKQAIILTARELLARPEGVVSERYKDAQTDVQTTYAAAPAGLPGAVSMLLAPWAYRGS